MADSTDLNLIASRQRIDVVDEAMAAILRKKTPAERLEIGFEMWRFARDMIRENVKAEHPQWSQSDVDRLVARRLSHGDV